MCLVHVDSLLKSNDYADKLRNDNMNSIRQQIVLPKHTRKPAGNSHGGKSYLGNFFFTLNFIEDKIFSGFKHVNKKLPLIGAPTSGNSMTGD